MDSKLRGRSWRDWMREEEEEEEEEERERGGEDGRKGEETDGVEEDRAEKKRQQEKQREAWGSAYFKSTDGHTGEWSFSLRRLNLQLFEVIGTCNGYVCSTFYVSYSHGVGGVMNLTL